LAIKNFIDAGLEKNAKKNSSDSSNEVDNSLEFTLKPFGTYIYFLD